MNVRLKRIWKEVRRSWDSIRSSVVGCGRACGRWLRSPQGTWVRLMVELVVQLLRWILN